MNKIDCLNSIILLLRELYEGEDDPSLVERLLDSISTLKPVLQAWQENRDENPEETVKDHKCLNCGNCCVKSTNQLGGASVGDIAIWITNKRFDILEWVDPVMLSPTEVARFDIWIDPETQDEARMCPWLQKNRGKKTYECIIHDVKPQVCKDFPASKSHAARYGCPVYQAKCGVTSKKSLINQK